MSVAVVQRGGRGPWRLLMQPQWRKRIQLRSTPKQLIAMLGHYSQSVWVRSIEEFRACSELRSLSTRLRRFAVPTVASNFVHQKVLVGQLELVAPGANSRPRRGVQTSV